MRTERVFTNLRCNQNCTYCTSRRATDERASIRLEAVRGRIDAALGAGAREIVLSGGEPTLRNDLEALVAHARAAGADRVVLETNATSIDPARAAALHAAGLGEARVNLAGWGEALDRVTQDPGGFEATRRGLCALGAAGVALSVQAAVVRSTASLLPLLPAGLAALPARVNVIHATVPTASPAPDELLPYGEAAAVIAALDEAARAVGIPVKLLPDSGPPPCVFPPKARVTHLFALTPGAPRRAGHTPQPACAECLVSDRCSGLADEHLARFGAPPMHPVGEDRVRRRLALISTVDEQVAREFVTPNRYRDPVHGELDEEIIRVNFHCNQTCRFCFVSTHLPPAGDEAVREAIRRAAAKGVKVTLSGGEPTLNPHLVEYVRLAKSLSPLPVLLQTNAIRLDDEALVAALVEAGLDEAFISLHGSTAAISDAVTGAPGTFVRTVVGIDRLYATRVKIVLNFVICETNVGDLVPYVRLVGARWPKAFVNISFVAPSTDVVPREREFIPRYSEALPHLQQAIAEARRLGLEIGGFESMCGIPLCLVPADLGAYFDLGEIPPGFDKGEFVKPEPCGRCDLAAKCYGLRRGYQDLHGADELRPISAQGDPRAAPVRWPATGLS